MLRRLATTIAMVGLLLMSAPLAALAEPMTFYADLSGAAEAPPNASSGSGEVTVIYDPVAHTLRVVASFSDLTGVTTNAHIHCCTETALFGTAGVATMLPTFAGFPAGVTEGTYDAVFDLTLASNFNPAFVSANGGTAAGAEAALFEGMLSGLAYFNVHSTVFPGGEIRGFLQKVPEPGTLALLTIGLATLVLLRRRRPA